MAEMIIPGTYIAVQSEGLISAGRVATGIVGVVGTAASGPIGVPITLSGFANAREIFGLPDSFKQPEDGTHPLTLVRALEQLYNNGASSVVAVRVAGSSQSSATYSVRDGSGNEVAVLTAATPGTWGNDLRVQVIPAEENGRIDAENLTTGFNRLTYAPIVPSAENRIRIFRGITKSITALDLVYKRVATNEEVKPNPAGQYKLANTPVEAVPAINQIQVVDRSGSVIRSYQGDTILYGEGEAPPDNQVRVNPATGVLTFAGSQAPGANRVLATYAIGHAAPTAGQVLLTTWDGSLTFAPGEAPSQENGDRLVASYLVDRSAVAQVSLSHGVITERYTVPDGKSLVQQLAASQLVTATVNSTHGGNRLQTNPAVSAFFGSGSNQPGNNGADAGSDEYTAGLESLANQLINIVVLAGQDAKTMGSVLLGHLKATEAVDLERIGVIGATGNTAAEFLGHDLADERVILVAPGIAFPDGTTLPAAYTAAAVAGLISSLPVQTSLTNKTLNVPGLAVELNRGQQEQLIKRNVLTVVPKQGFRIIKGVTTSGEGTPFSSIPTRRIVDYAKYGVRSAANPYLGRLNNSRVRAAMKATLDAFLTRMVEDEALTGYELEVTATRSQEIAGEVSIVMTIQPTFSIEYIRVTMILK
ncbi:phage tail sheath subtilisin-like domain-containing protein [Kovacikia minuta CCNUW1]|uniref:phage tail sheath subtilisin-like domain-containing protein n=1 Tax=Kovacikia minuta TaxID=2931930 RepID=UPI001CCE377C|nr:phage tail sheath subtilisin-like domain-containing protein [Kovacikia minuta]UBF27089.1 phage tail sheath subtilisin-like domain-containing protein [Kovacikia minuta CCNUW1]